MKKLILLIIFVLFTTMAYSHSTKNLSLDSKVECKKSKSMLNWVSKNKSITGQVIAIDSGQSLNWQTPDIMGGKE